MWQFWIDRGGTFTDVIAMAPDGRLHVRKVLSRQVESAGDVDAGIVGMRRILESELGPRESFSGCIQSVKVGTTVATSAVLERQGVPVLLVTAAGFADAVIVGSALVKALDSGESALRALTTELATGVRGRAAPLRGRHGASAGAARPRAAAPARAAAPRGRAGRGARGRRDVRARPGARAGLAARARGGPGPVGRRGRPPPRGPQARDRRDNQFPHDANSPSTPGATHHSPGPGRTSAG